MAHEISTQADGRAAMVFRGETPWHRLGNRISDEEARDLDFALAEAGIGFDVKKVPHYVKLEEEYRQSEDSFSVIRTDTEDVIGTVGSVWQPLQNQEAFAPLRQPLDDGLAVIETGGVLRNGKQVWMLVQFDQEGILEKAAERMKEGQYTADELRRLVETLTGEEGGGILPYGLFLNDHSGGGKARVKEIAIRVVCANTLDWALAQDGGIEIAVAHTSRVSDDYAEATDRLFGDLVGRYVNLANFRQILRAALLTERAFNALVLERAFPILHLEEKIRRREANGHTHTALRKKSESRNRVRDLWENGTGMSGRPTAWDAYNALVEYVDHDPEAYQGTDRATSMVDGSLAKSKRYVFRDLMHYADLDEVERTQHVAAILN